ADLAIAKFDVDIALREDSGGLTAELTYATDLFDEATAAGLAARWVQVLDASTADPTAAIGDIALLSDSEADRALGWSVPAPLPQKTFPEILAAGVAANPDGVAVVEGHRQLTYTEL